jgi:hypothetical protein
MRFPVQLWQLLTPLEAAERQYVLDAVQETMPYDLREAEREYYLSILPRRPTRANGRPGVTRLADHDGVTVSHSYIDTVRVALFEIAAPAVRGCRVTIESATSRRGSAEWSVALSGGRAGGKVEVRTTLKAEFSVEAGQRKRVFADVPASIVTIFEVRDSRLYPRLARVGSPDKRTRSTPIPGVESIKGTEPGRVERLALFSLAGDKSLSTSTYTYEYERSREVAVQLRRSVKVLEVTGVELGLGSTVGVAASVKLTLVLAAGHDYEMYATDEYMGITWVST